MQESNDRTPKEGSRKRAKPDVDPAMVLTPEEKQWALNIKKALQADDEILARVFTDMEIAIFAIIDEDNIERSLERATCLQAFRMQYNINDTPEEGVALHIRIQEICPGLVLSIDECPNDDGKGSHVCVINLGKYYPYRFFQHPKDHRCNIGSLYYEVMCLQPDFQSVRDGFRQVIELNGVGWQNMSFKTEMKNIDELLSFLPYRRKQVKCLRAPSVALMILSMMRPFMPKEEHDGFCYGTAELQAEFPEPIDQFYLQPNPEEAFQKVLSKIHDLLTRRYENQKTFRLD